MNMIKTLVASALLAVSFSASAAVITFDADGYAVGGTKFKNNTFNYSFDLGSVAKNVDFAWGYTNTSAIGNKAAAATGSVTAFLDNVQLEMGSGKSFTSGGFTWEKLTGNHTLKFVTAASNGYEGKLNFNLDATVAPVPEPETYALMGMGLLGLLAARRRKAAK